MFNGVLSVLEEHLRKQRKKTQWREYDEIGCLHQEWERQTNAPKRKKKIKKNKEKHSCLFLISQVLFGIVP